MILHQKTYVPLQPTSLEHISVCQCLKNIDSVNTTLYITTLKSFTYEKTNIELQSQITYED